MKKINLLFLLISILLAACSTVEPARSTTESMQEHLYRQASDNRLDIETVSKVTICYNSLGDATLSFVKVDQIDAKKLDTEGFVLIGDNLAANKKINEISHPLTSNTDRISFIIFYHSPNDVILGDAGGLYPAAQNKIQFSIVTDELIEDYTSLGQTVAHNKSYHFTPVPNQCFIFDTNK